MDKIESLDVEASAPERMHLKPCTGGLTDPVFKLADLIGS